MKASPRRDSVLTEEERLEGDRMQILTICHKFIMLFLIADEVEWFGPILGLMQIRQ